MRVSNLASRSSSTLLSTRARIPLVLAGAALFSACPSSSSSGSDPYTFFSLHSTRQAVAVGTPIVFSGSHYAFLALESSGS